MEYKKQHNTCRVPFKVPGLGQWTKNQRDYVSAYLKGKKPKCSQEKIDKLLSIGFEESLHSVDERVMLRLKEGEEPIVDSRANVNEDEDEEAATHQEEEEDDDGDDDEVMDQHHGEQQEDQVYEDEQQYHQVDDPVDQHQYHDAFN